MQLLKELTKLNEDTTTFEKEFSVPLDHIYKSEGNKDKHSRGGLVGKFHDMIKGGKKLKPLYVIPVDERLRKISQFVNTVRKYHGPHGTIPDEKKWYLLDGHHRLSAYEKAGMKEVPVIVRAKDVDHFKNMTIPQLTEALITRRGLKKEEQKKAMATKAADLTVYLDQIKNEKNLEAAKVIALEMADHFEVGGIDKFKRAVVMMDSLPRLQKLCYDAYLKGMGMGTKLY